MVAPRISHDPLFVAEMSGNHNGSLANALKIVEAMAKTGAHAVKLQTYTADTITLDVNSAHFRISDSHPLWGGAKLFDLYTQAHTPWEWHKEIFDLSTSLGLIPFSTPFDLSAVDFLESLGNSIYKIASIEIGHHPLIAAVAQTSKPLILSTGAATLEEIEEAVGVAESNGAGSITLLVCTSDYPAKPEDANLARLQSLRQRFGLAVGLSDHTHGIGVSVAAVALGASVIEKHVKLSGSAHGVDSEFSLTPDQFSSLVDESTRAKKAIGLPDSWNTEAESESRRLRPSIYISEDVQPGDIASFGNVRIARPSGGLEPKEFDRVLGMSFSQCLTKGTPLKWEHVLSATSEE